MTKAFWAYGSKLQLGDGATPEVFADIAELIELDLPTMKRDTIDVSNHQSLNATREKIAGWRDGGQVKWKANWIPSDPTQDGTTGLLSAYDDGKNHNWKIIAPDDIVTLIFSGPLNEFKPDLPLDKQGTIEGSIDVSGNIQYITPSGS